MHNISWFPFNFLDTFVEELFEVYNSVKLISYLSAQIEDRVWSVAASYERCAILQQGALCPDIFCKGPTHGNLCAHMQRISLCWPQAILKNQHVIHSVHMQAVSKKIASSHYLVLRDISEWQIDKNLARQGWWEIHFHCQIGISPGSRVLNE